MEVFKYEEMLSRKQTWGMPCRMLSTAIGTHAMLATTTRAVITVVVVFTMLENPSSQ